MKKVKKGLAILLAAMMLISFAGCGEQAIEGSLTEPEGEVAFPAELSIFAAKGASLFGDMVDYNEVTSFKLLEEATGTHINWTLPPGSGFNEKFNLMIAGGELPDMIINDWYSLGAEEYIEDGILVDISPYVPKYMPNLWKFSEEHPDLARAYIADGGKIFTPCMIRKDQRLNVFFGPVIRTDWLEKLNLKAPTTADELYTVLKAFKEKDPNGNGKADEVPMSQGGAGNPDCVTYLMHMFNTTNNFYLKDGKVTYGIMEPEFVEGLEYVAKLYKEGLLDVDFLLQDRTALLGKITNNQVGFSFEYQPTQVMTNMKDDPTFKFEGIPNLKDKRGNIFTMQSAYTNGVITSRAAGITTACKDPFGAMKWLDFIYGEEGHVIANFGKEGETFNYNAEGTPIFVDEIQNNADPNLTRSQVWGKHFLTYNTYFPSIQDWDSYGAYLSEHGRAAVETWTKDVVTDMNLPTLTFDAEQKETLKLKFTPIQTYVAEQMSKMILGQKPVSDIPAVVEQIKSMGVEDVVAIYQSAYDSYMKKDIGF